MEVSADLGSTSFAYNGRFLIGKSIKDKVVVPRCQHHTSDTNVDVYDEESRHSPTLLGK